MPRGQKRSHEQFVEEMNRINPNIQIIGRYINVKTKILCKCKIDGYEWEVVPSSILKGHGCPFCGGNVPKSHEQFVKEMNEINSNILILEKYINSETKLLCKCKIDGNVWYAKPHSLLEGHGCPLCYEQTIKTHEKFVSEMSLIHPTIKILGAYKNNKTDVLCECLICHFKWNGVPNRMLSGNHCGCPKCGGTLKITHEEFIEKMNHINSNIEILGHYKNSKTRVKCKCKKDGYIWEAIPNNLMNGIGCPNCTISKGENKIFDYLNKFEICCIQQKKFDDLIGTGGNKLSYDFYIPKHNLLIEYNGKQHYESIEYFGGEKIFLKQQKHDNIKQIYAKSNNYNLLIIPYWEFDNIEKILDNYFMNNNPKNCSIQENQSNDSLLLCSND